MPTAPGAPCPGAGWRDRAYRLGAVRPGDSLAVARRRLRLRLAYTIGRNHWYLTGGRRVRGVLKVQGGHALEIGIADGRLVTSRAGGPAPAGRLSLSPCAAVRPGRAFDLGRDG